jgi:HD-like signal output (HDOD) protein/DNA-binding NarL/FixJ family response regulator
MFVDDDPMLLASTRRQLMMQLPDCELVFFSTAAAAIEDITITPPQIVFSDVRMPGMDGAEFLSRVAVTNPETIRFAWTGQSEAQQLERVFKVAHQVIGKPAPSEKLVELITTLTCYRSKLQGSSLLPALTAANQDLFDCARLRDVLELLDDPNTSAERVANEIDKSPVARARLLGLANSSFFSPAITISDTNQGVTMVGFGIVRAIFLASQFSCVDKPAAVTVELNHCTDRGVETALAVRELADREGMNEDNRNSATIAAVFHLFGRVQFAVHGGDDYTRLKRESDGDAKRLLQREKEHFGVDRYSLAAYTLSIWGMDSLGCKAIAALSDPAELECRVSAILREAIQQTRP